MYSAEAFNYFGICSLSVILSFQLNDNVHALLNIATIQISILPNKKRNISPKESRERIAINV